MDCLVLKEGICYSHFCTPFFYLFLRFVSTFVGGRIYSLTGSLHTSLKLAAFFGYVQAFIRSIFILVQVSFNKGLNVQFMYYNFVQLIACMYSSQYIIIHYSMVYAVVPIRKNKYKQMNNLVSLVYVILPFLSLY